MNIFYAPPSQINNGFVELTGQEATHASQVLRAKEGDKLVIVDGEGGRFEGLIRRITKQTVQVEIKSKREVKPNRPLLVLGMGIIKKRDRLEFAVEKAVELGAYEISLFRSEHTVKENVRMDRLESIAISAMKQSLRAWLPEITFHRSFDSLLDTYADCTVFAAHEKINSGSTTIDIADSEKNLLLVGPEGGFSPNEIAMLKSRNVELVSLGQNRLRTETAALVFLSKFLSPM